MRAREVYHVAPERREAFERSRGVCCEVEKHKPIEGKRSIKRTSSQERRTIKWIEEQLSVLDENGITIFPTHPSLRPGKIDLSMDWSSLQDANLRQTMEYNLSRWPRLSSHLWMRARCAHDSAEGSLKHFGYGMLKVCSNPECRKPHYIPMPCGSALCERCQKILEGRIKAKFGRQMIDAPHYYMVFTLPDEVRCSIPRGNWAAVRLLMEAVRRTLYELLHAPTLSNPWGAWVGPHAYGTQDLGWKPHLNVLLYSAVPFPYVRVRPIFRKHLQSVFRVGVRENYKELQMDFQIKTPEECLDVLTTYIRGAPIPHHIKHSQDGTLTFKIFDKKHNCWYPEQTLTGSEFLDRLERIIPEKGFRTIRRWGFYAPHNKLRERLNPPTFNTSKDRHSFCKCCADAYGPALFRTSHSEVIRLGKHIDSTDTHDFNLAEQADASRPALREFLQLVQDCLNRRGPPPKLHLWYSKLEEEHRRTCPTCLEDAGHEARTSSPQADMITPQLIEGSGEQPKITEEHLED